MTAKQLEQYFQKLIQQKGQKALYSIQVFLAHEKAPFRQRAVRALAGLSYEVTQEHLEPLLQDRSIAVRKEVVSTLVSTRDPVAKETLETYALSVIDPQEREYVLLSLKKFEAQVSGVLTVFDFVQYVNTLVGEETVAVEGEVSSFQTSSYGANQWVFFDLKDEEKQAKIRCFTTIFTLRKSRVSLMDGIKITVTGKPRLSAKSGFFSLNVDTIEVSGEGELLKAFELLKNQLNQEGLFVVERKRPLPPIPQCIGLITSQDAAAYRDFMKVLTHRMGGLDIYFHHAQVQGQKAVDSIIQAIKQLNTYPDVEVIVLTRGGGSMDDLHAFNDEAVARAIYSSKKPIISAIGHERDETIADYVADFRASTPSNAAELVTPAKAELLAQTEAWTQQMKSSLETDLQSRHTEIDTSLMRIRHSIGTLRRRFDNLTQKLHRTLSLHRKSIHMQQTHIKHLEETVTQRMHQSVERHQEKIKHLERYIRSFDHKIILSRGYSITRFHGKIITSIQSLSRGDHIETEVSDGRYTSVITTQSHENNTTHRT